MAKSDDQLSLIKLLAIWIGSFAVCALIVFVVIYLERIGLKELILNLLVAASAWTILLWLAYKSIENRMGEKLPLFEPQSTWLSKIMTITLLLFVLGPLVSMAVISTRSLMNL